MLINMYSVLWTGSTIRLQYCVRIKRISAHAHQKYKYVHYSLHMLKNMLAALCAYHEASQQQYVQYYLHVLKIYFQHIMHTIKNQCKCSTICVVFLHVLKIYLQYCVYIIKIWCTCSTICTVFFADAQQYTCNIVCIS